MGKVVTVNGCTGPVDTFIVEPFIPHSEEFYLSIQVLRQRICILVFCASSKA
jgi:ATP citrate (pro-S)-lyase